MFVPIMDPCITHTQEQCIEYAKRLKSVNYDNETYYQVPGQLGELGLHISKDGTAFNSHSGKIRQWVTKYSASIRDLDHIGQKKITMTYKINGKNHGVTVTNVGAMCAVFVPPIEDRNIAKTLVSIDDDKFDLSSLYWDNRKAFRKRCILVTVGGEKFIYISLNRLFSDLSRKMNWSYEFTKTEQINASARCKDSGIAIRRWGTIEFIDLEKAQQLSGRTLPYIRA